MWDLVMAQILALTYVGGMMGVRATVRASPDHQHAVFDLHAGRIPLVTGARATRDANGKLVLDPAARRVLRRRFVTLHNASLHHRYIDVDATAPLVGRCTIRLDIIDDDATNETAPDVSDGK